jgi:hypothetical protein
MRQAYKRSLFEGGDGIEFDENGKPIFYDDDSNTDTTAITTTTSGAITTDSTDGRSIDDAKTQRKKSALERSSIKAKLQVQCQTLTVQLLAACIMKADCYMICM